MDQKKVRVTLGQIAWSRGVADLAEEDTEFSKHALECLRRHAGGDWGDLSDEDKKLNDQALREGTRILSAYTHEKHPKIWIITEWDRSVTTTLFPDEN